MSEEAKPGEPLKATPTVGEIPLEELEKIVVAAGAPKDTAAFMKKGWTSHLKTDSRTITDTLGAASIEGIPSAK